MSTYFRIKKDSYLWVKLSNSYNLDRHDIEKKNQISLISFSNFYEAKTNNKAFSKCCAKQSEALGMEGGFGGLAPPRKF